MVTTNVNPHQRIKWEPTIKQNRYERLFEGLKRSTSKGLDKRGLKK